LHTQAIPIAARLAFAAGCASTTLQSTWHDPAYSSGPFRKIFVIGLSARDVTARRVFEDVMVSKLRAAGVQAVPGWQYIKADGQAPEGEVSAAVADAGADAVLMARLVAIDKQISVNPIVVPGPAYGWYGPYAGWYGPYAGWYGAGWYAYPSVQQYDVVYVETTLFDAKTKRLVWSGTSKTVDPASVQQEAPGFADTIIGALQQAGLLPAPKP